ncbi:hypothetical protein AB685_21845 [Bacillus sp. LL01]|nr:hypothetical protein AB685_21845 [Bacillus sp. LL01]
MSIVEEKPNPGPYPGTTLVPITEAWADIRTMQGREFNSATIAGNVGVSRFIIRYMPGLSARMRVQYKGVTYSIKSLTNDDEQNRTITIIGEAIL